MRPLTSRPSWLRAVRHGPSWISGIRRRTRRSPARSARCGTPANTRRRGSAYGTHHPPARHAPWGRGDPHRALLRFSHGRGVGFGTLLHTAHEALILTGTLMLAVSAVMSHLVLAKREALGLFWALLATGYGLSVGTVLQGILGQHAFGPSSSPMVMIAFIANAIGIGGSVIATALVV